MPKWYDTAVNELEDALETGAITQKQYKLFVRDLNEELEEVSYSSSYDPHEERDGW